jgi:hypothetical protein
MTAEQGEDENECAKQQYDRARHKAYIGHDSSSTHAAAYQREPQKTQLPPFLLWGWRLGY